MRTTRHTDTERPMAFSLKRFHDDVRGTAMTEFVIAAPIFVFMFSAILRLYRFEELAVQSRGNSYAQALRSFHDGQSSLNPIAARMSPIPAAIAAGLWHRGTSSGTDLAADAFYDTVPIGGGLFLEQRSRLLLAGTVNSVADDVELDPKMLYMNIRGLTNNMPIEPAAMGRDTIMTNELLGDQVNLSGMGNVSGPLSAANAFLTTAGARPAVGAGIRYGVTEGKWDAESEPFLGQTWTTQSWSHHAMPSRPTSKWITIGLIHAYLGDNKWDTYNSHIPRFEMTVRNGNDPKVQQANDCKAELDSFGPLDDLSEDEAKAISNQLKNSPNCSGLAGGSTDFISGLMDKFNNAASILQAPQSLLPSRGENMSTGNHGSVDNPFNQ